MKDGNGARGLDFFSNKILNLFAHGSLGFLTGIRGLQALQLRLLRHGRLPKYGAANFADESRHLFGLREFAAGLFFATILEKGIDFVDFFGDGHT